MIEMPASDENLEKALIELAHRKTRLIKARQSIHLQSNDINQTLIVIKGWICATKNLHDGREQTISILIEGDICNFDPRTNFAADLSFRALSDSIVLEVSRERLMLLAAESPLLSFMMECSALVQTSIWRERLLSLGQRTAKERCAHLICEMFRRLSAVGVAHDRIIDFPLTQEELGSVLGVTTVHANRVMQDLRTSGFIEQRHRRLRIRDLHALERLSLFNANYLNIDCQGQRLALVRGISARLFDRKPRSPFHERSPLR